MKTTALIFLCSAGLFLGGCATSSQVQEMIDNAQTDYTARLEAQAGAIEQLEAATEAVQQKAQGTANTVTSLEAGMNEALARLKVAQGYADAAKLMSADNTVKVANLNDKLEAYKESVDKALAQLDEIDELYEGVMLEHYRAVIESATKAVDALKRDGVTSSNDAPVQLSAPIEIVAPDTTAVTNISTNATPAAAVTNQ